MIRMSAVFEMVYTNKNFIEPSIFTKYVFFTPFFHVPGTRGIPFEDSQFGLTGPVNIQKGLFEHRVQDISHIFCEELGLAEVFTRTIRLA